MEKFSEISVWKASDAVELVGREWMLIGAADQERGGANAMTASWGTLGCLWSKPVVTCYIRPQRYTYGLAEKEERISFSFFGKEKREALAYCGKYSGRDGDKLLASGLGYEMVDGVPVFDDARLVLICRKIYADDIKETAFIDPSVAAEHYPEKDYHRFYVCEIEKCLVKN